MEVGSEENLETEFPVLGNLWVLGPLTKTVTVREKLHFGEDSIHSLHVLNLRGFMVIQVDVPH